MCQNLKPIVHNLEQIGRHVLPDLTVLSDHEAERSTTNTPRDPEPITNDTKTYTAGARQGLRLLGSLPRHFSQEVLGVQQVHAAAGRTHGFTGAR